VRCMGEWGKRKVKAFLRRLKSRGAVHLVSLAGLGHPLTDIMA